MCLVYTYQTYVKRLKVMIGIKSLKVINQKHLLLGLKKCLAPNI